MFNRGMGRIIGLVVVIGCILVLGLQSVAWAAPMQKPVAQTIPPATDTPTPRDFGPRPDDDDDDDDDEPQATPEDPVLQTATAFVATETAFVATQTAQASITATATPDATQTAIAVEATTNARATANAAATQTAAALADEATVTPTPTTLVPVELPETAGEVSGGIMAWFWLALMLVVTAVLILLARVRLVNR